MMDSNTSHTLHVADNSSINTGQFIVGFILTGLFCLFGLVINVCVYLVVLQIKVLCRYMWYLLSLTFFDWLICLAAIFHLVLPAYCTYFQAAWLIHFLNSHSSLWIADAYIYSTVQCAEIWITVALTADRFWLICQPFESGSLFDKRRTKKTICVVAVMALFYNIPKLIFFCYNRKDDNSRWPNNNDSSNTVTSTPLATVNTTAAVLQWESSSNNLCIGGDTQDWSVTWAYCTFYSIILNWLLLYILPTLALCFYNVKLFLKVRTAKRHLCKVSTLKAGKKDSLWATINIIALVIFFITCQTPSFVFKVCAFLQIVKYNGIVYQVTELILVINSACNFVVYFLIFGLFRRLALSFFCGHKMNKEPTDQVSKTCSSNTFARRSRPVKVKYTYQKSINGSFYEKTDNGTIV